MKFWQKIKFLFVVMGSGEASHAYALSFYLKKRGVKNILIALLSEKILHFFRDNKNIFLVNNPLELKKLVEREGVSAIIFFNSKTWTRKYPEFKEKSIFSHSLLSFSVDSNWLFNNKKYFLLPFIEWLDYYFVIFPPKIFELGLKNKGGDFVIPKKNLKKIIPTGFVPFYSKPSKSLIKKIRRKIGILPQEKFIFSYFSGYGALHRTWAFYNFIKAMDLLTKKHQKIKAMYLGPTADLEPKMLKRKWLILKEKLSSKDFFLHLASSDLVFQHQGMATLAQVISCQIPVIANVSKQDNRKPMTRLHFWELNPFKRAGVCEVFSKTTPIKKISAKIETLLYNEKVRKTMQEKQKQISQGGEAIIWNFIKKFIEQKIKENEIA
jgi:hypothetical protein